RSFRSGVTKEVITPPQVMACSSTPPALEIVKRSMAVPSTNDPKRSRTTIGSFLPSHVADSHLQVTAHARRLVHSPMTNTIFPSFFMGGFECSTHRLPSGRRLDVLGATAHDRFALQDYKRLADIGMYTA